MRKTASGGNVSYMHLVRILDYPIGRYELIDAARAVDILYTFVS